MLDAAVEWVTGRLAGGILGIELALILLLVAAGWWLGGWWFLAAILIGMAILIGGGE